MNPTKHFKKDYRQLLLALKADIKAHGGYDRAAENLNISGDTLCNQVNPDNDVNPPTFANVVEIINTIHAKRTVAALANLVDMCLFDVSAAAGPEENQIEAYLKVAGKASDLLSTGFKAAEDNRFDAIEREQLLALLLELMQKSGLLYKSLNR